MRAYAQPALLGAATSGFAIWGATAPSETPVPRFGSPLPCGSLQSERDDALYLGIRNLAQRARARLVQQTGQLLAHEAMPPATHGL